MDGLVKEAEPRARRTLKASPAMVARLGKAAAQHAADKPAEPPPLAQQKPALAQPKPTSNEVAKINPPLDPEAAALRRARRERQNALFLKLREISPALFVAKPPPLAIGINAAIV